MTLRSLERFGSALLMRARNRGFRAREARPPSNDAPALAPEAVAVDRDRRARLVLTIATAVILVSLAVFAFA
jgi:hypothetical protein